MNAPQIVLPRAGITLLPPWWAFILWSDKRHENRAPSVTGRVRGWRGLIGLSASKIVSRDAKEEAVMLACAAREEIDVEWNEGTPTPFPPRLLWELGGHLLGVAELLDVVHNGEEPRNKWQMPQENSLVLGRVWEIDPIPCSGARGIYALGACAACGHVGAIENKAAPLKCRRCKASTPRERLGRPELKVLREYTVDGVLVTPSGG